MAFAINIIAVAPLYTQGVVIQWELIDPPDIGVYTFVVRRSGAPGGPWEDLTSIDDTYIYTDTAASLDGLTRDLYYQVEVAPPVAANLISSSHNIRNELTLGLAGRHFLRARKMRSDLLRTFQKFSGREYYILKRRHWGIRCPDCWDTLTKTVLDEDCTTCYSVGFKGGYFTKVLVWGRIDPTNISAPIQLTGKEDQRMTKFTMLDIPVLMPDDVIIGKDDDRRYIVHTQGQTEMKLVGIHQDLSVAELPRDNPVYAVGV